MLPCLKPLTPPPPPPTSHYFSSPASQGHYLENTSPRSSAVQSPIDLTQEFSLATQTNSYGEIRQTLNQDISSYETIRIEEEHVEIIIEEPPPQLLDQVLRPSREFVQEAISIIGTNSLTSSLITSYFEHSEDISRLCLLLHQSIRRVRALYKPIHDLLDDFFDEDDSHSLSESQFMFAYNLFVKFDSQENPFLSSNSQCFDDLRRCFSNLRQEFDAHVRKSRSRSRTNLCSKGPALCLIAAAIGVAISAVAIASHALMAIILSPMCLTVLPLNKAKKGKVNASQLNAAAQGIYVLHQEIDTIDRVIAHLNAVVENDKLLIRLGLERGMDKYHVQEILRQLHRNRSSFVERLVHVEENLFLCFIAINRARALLLQEIHLQSRDS